MPTYGGHLDVGPKIKPPSENQIIAAVKKAKARGDRETVEALLGLRLVARMTKGALAGAHDRITELEEEIEIMRETDAEVARRGDE